MLKHNTPQTDYKNVRRYQFYFGSHKEIRLSREYIVHACHLPVTSIMNADHTQHLAQVTPMNYLHRICTFTLSDYV